MKRARRVVALLPLISLVAVSMIWANGNSEKSSQANAVIPENAQLVTADRIGNPNAPTEITYSVQLTYSQQANIPLRVDYLTKASTEWAKSHPNFKLTPQIQGGTAEEIFQKLLQQVASNTQPDFFQIDGQWVPLLYSHLQPLDGYFSQDEINDWFDWARQTMIDPSDHKLKSLWFTTNAVGLWYRKDLIPNPPTTWDRWIATAKNLESQGFKNGWVTRGYDEQIPYGAVLPMFYGLGGKLVDSSGKPIFGEGQNRDAMVQVFDFWNRAVKEGVVPNRIVDIKADGDMVADASKPKQAAMILGGSWILSQMKDVLKGDLDNWDFTYTPQKSADIRKQVAGGYNWGFFTKDKAKLQAAIDFVQTVYTSRDGMAGFCYAAGYTPLRKSVLDSPQFKNDRWQQAFASVVEAATTRPGVKAYATISVNLQNAFQSVILGQETPAQAVDSAFKQTMSQVSS